MTKQERKEAATSANADADARFAYNVLVDYCMKHDNECNGCIFDTPGKYGECVVCQPSSWENPRVRMKTEYTGWRKHYNDLDALLEIFEKNPEDSELKERIYYLKKYNKTRANVDAMNKRLPGHYGAKEGG